MFVHPTKDTQEFYGDISECEARAGQAAGNYDAYGVVRERVRDNCMRGKGWVPEKEAKRASAASSAKASYSTPANSSPAASGSTGRGTWSAPIGGSYDCLRDEAYKAGIDIEQLASWSIRTQDFEVNRMESACQNSDQEMLKALFAQIAKAN